MILTQEQKEILIKDICCRLPYGVKIQTDYTDIKILEGIQFPNYIGISDGYYSLDNVECKPYLFPLSSMTEEQEKELLKVYSDEAELIVEHLHSDILDNAHGHRFNHQLSLNWYLKNHFDINGLIEMGLAIDCSNLNIY